MKSIVLTLAAVMTLGASFAQAGAERALNDKKISCEVTLADGTSARITRAITNFDMAQKNVGGTLITLQQSSGLLTISAASEGGGAVIQGRISAHGYFHGNTEGMSANCMTH